LREFHLSILKGLRQATLAPGRSGSSACASHTAIMKRIRIIHETQYYYNQPVKFGPHRAMLRPREGHDVHISRSRLDVMPVAAVRWLRDIYGNSIAVLTFEKPARKLSVAAACSISQLAGSDQRGAGKTGGYAI